MKTPCYPFEYEETTYGPVEAEVGDIFKLKPLLPKEQPWIGGPNRGGWDEVVLLISKEVIDGLAWFQCVPIEFIAHNAEDIDKSKLSTAHHIFLLQDGLYDEEDLPTQAAVAWGLWSYKVSENYLDSCLQGIEDAADLETRFGTFPTGKIDVDQYIDSRQSKDFIDKSCKAHQTRGIYWDHAFYDECKCLLP